MSTQRVGLVLGVGAANGAYQIGCWKALVDLGISRFVAISGASVGALNAALVAMGDFELAENLWIDLSADQVYFNPGGPLRSAILKLATVRLPFRLGWRPGKQKTALLLSRWFHIASNRPLNRLIRRYVSLDKLRLSDTRVFCTEALYTGYYNPYEPLYLDNLDRPIGFEGGMPIYELHLEPENQHWPTWEWIPHVTELTSLSEDNDVVFSLLASANLPLFFRRRRRGRIPSTDGGIAERLPIYPVCKEDCDLIIAISLDAGIDPPTPERLETYVSHEYLRRDVLLPLSRSEADNLYRGFCAEGFPDQPKPPFSIAKQKFLFIAPSRPLGNAFDFTGGSRVRDLIDLGFQDTRTALALM